MLYVRHATRITKSDSPPGSRGIYARGTARGDCHHWRAGGAAAPRGPSGAGSVAAHEMSEQSSAICPGDAQCSRHQLEAPLCRDDDASPCVLGVTGLALLRAERDGATIRHDGRLLSAAEYGSQYI